MVRRHAEPREADVGRTQPHIRHPLGVGNVPALVDVPPRNAGRQMFPGDELALRGIERVGLPATKGPALSVMA